jgi:hypothetical protein
MTAIDNWSDGADQDAPPDPDSLPLDRDQLAQLGELSSAEVDPDGADHPGGDG